MSRWSVPLFWAAGTVVFVTRSLVPERSLTSTGPRAVFDAFFALALLLLVLTLSFALGRRSLSLLRVGPTLSGLEGSVFAFAAGAGILAYACLGLGLLGAFTPAGFLVLLMIAGLAAGPELRQVLVGVQLVPRRLAAMAVEGGLLGRATLGMGGALVFLCGLQALTPPWDYDGLMYHLQAPRLYLEAGRIFLTPDIWQANGPSTAEMLFSIGLAFQSDTFPRLLHLSFDLLVVLATAGVAWKTLGPFAGWSAAAILLGIPIFPIWGTLAYSDLVWALFELLAILAMIHWAAGDGDAWLLLAGSMAGLALGSKYLAAGLIPLLIVWVGVERWRAGLWKTLSAMARVVGCAALVASPWYLKNLAWTGNPVYPFFLGGPEWPAGRLAYLMTYLQSFGTGYRLQDLLALPWNVYARHTEFATFMTTIEIPGLIFPVAAAFPWASTGRWRALGPATVIRVIFWWLGSQQIRFLLPVFPVVTLMASSVFTALARRYATRRGLRIVAPALLVGLLATGLVYQGLFLANTRPTAVIAGFESKDSFLRRSVYDYDVVRGLRQAKEQDWRVYMLWDGQGYYCDERCLPDAEQSQWVQLVDEADSVEGVTQVLRARQVTHLLFDVEGFNFFLGHDPSGAHARAALFLLHTYQPACLAELRRTPKVILYELTCGSGGPAGPAGQAASFVPNGSK